MTPPRPATVFGLLRHGQTVWNLEKRIQGSGNSALTREGIDNCRRWARHLSTAEPVWHRIISSPLQRARETASLLNEELGLPLHLEDGIREQDWGAWEGQTLEAIKQRWPRNWEQLLASGWDFRPPDGESRREVLARAQQALRECSTRWPGENLLIVTHLGIIKTLLYAIENRAFLPREPKIVHRNRFHTVAWDGETFKLLQRDLKLPEDA